MIINWLNTIDDDDNERLQRLINCIEAIECVGKVIFKGGESSSTVQQHLVFDE